MTIAAQGSAGAPGPINVTASAAAWIRVNLLDGPANTVLTLLTLVGLYLVLPPLVDWALVKSVWTADSPAACRAAEGACWAIVHAKLRLILFGRYPFELQWRPLLAMVLLVGTAIAATDRRRWGNRLVYAWVGMLLAYLYLLGGGQLRLGSLAIGLRPVPSALWGGLPLTLLLSFAGISLAFPLALLLALARRSQLPLIKALAVGYIELIRGVPLISLLFMASFMLPLFMPPGVSIDAVLRAQVAIVLFAAAYLAEVIRGGLQSLPKGQVEAADALGLGYWRAQRLIVLPQALKLVIPPMVNTFIGLFKDTSLVAIVSLTDLLLSTRQAVGDPEWRMFFVEAYIFTGLIYWVFCFAMSRYSQHLERALSTGQRR